MSYDLHRVVRKYSKAFTFKKAAREWTVTQFMNFPGQTCVCGKQNIVKCYTISNHITHAELFPIGSHCVLLFESNRLNRQMEIVQRNPGTKKTFSSWREDDDDDNMSSHSDEMYDDCEGNGIYDTESEEDEEKEEEEEEEEDAMVLVDTDEDEEGDTPLLTRAKCVFKKEEKEKEEEEDAGVLVDTDDEETPKKHY